ncbi:hypothetical protein ACPCHQ_21780 [Ralstonia thomasii]|uniref:hypothetical protein n=1 Tax=Ralstonia thomasii TaxID=3058596 RepID=UPI003C2AED54
MSSRTDQVTIDGKVYVRTLRSDGHKHYGICRTDGRYQPLDVRHAKIIAKIEAAINAKSTGA